MAGMGNIEALPLLVAETCKLTGCALIGLVIKRTKKAHMKDSSCVSLVHESRPITRVHTPKISYWKASSLIVCTRTDKKKKRF